MAKILDFTFYKNRGFGELLSDFFSLFKQIAGHFNRCIFSYILPFLALFLVMFFLVSSLGVNIFYSSQWKPTAAFTIIIALISLAAFVFFVFLPTFSMEYIFLLKEKENMDFTGRDVWKRVSANFGKYIIYFLGSILVVIIIAIPMLLAFMILNFIPVIGQFAIGILMSCVSLVFMMGLFLYVQKGEIGLFDSFIKGYKLLKKKFFMYGLAAYVFRLLLQICLGLIVTIPAVIIGIIAFNTIGFSNQMFISFWGKVLLSVGGTLLVLFLTVSSLYAMVFYNLIYFSTLETTAKQGTFEEIDTIGSDNIASQNPSND